MSSPRTRLVSFALTALAVCASPASARAGVGERGAARDDETASAWLALEPLTPTSWLAFEPQKYQLPTLSDASLLRRYRNPRFQRVAAWRTFYDGPFATRARRAALPELSWNASSCAASGGSPELTWLGAERTRVELAAAALVPPSPGTDLLQTWALSSAPEPLLELFPVAKDPICPPSSGMREVAFGRFGGETDRFALMDCHGRVHGDALERLSVLARPTHVERPELPLPDEPDADARHGEWVAGVKMLHPRLIWVLQRITHAYPYRPVYIVSGYRPDSHGSYHERGRALDVFVSGLANEDLFRFCRKLQDVGCGYYPHHNFVHIDTREYGMGHPFWIDASEPGTPSRYVDSWPGVVEGGALAGVGLER